MVWNFKIIQEDFIMNLITLTAAQQQANGLSGLLPIIMMVLMFVILWFFMIRPQKKKQKEEA